MIAYCLDIRWRVAYASTRVWDCHTILLNLDLKLAVCPTCRQRVHRQVGYSNGMYYLFYFILIFNI